MTPPPPGSLAEQIQNENRMRKLEENFKPRSGVKPNTTPSTPFAQVATFPLGEYMPKNYL